MKKITILILLLFTLVGCSSSKLQTSPDLKKAYMHILQLDWNDHSSLNINYLKQYLSDISCEETEIYYSNYENNPYFNKNSVIALKYEEDGEELEIKFDKDNNSVFEMIYTNNRRGEGAASIYAPYYFASEASSSSEDDTFYFYLSKITSNPQEHVKILKDTKNYTFNKDFNAYLTILQELKSKQLVAKKRDLNQSLNLAQLEKIMGYKHIAISNHDPNCVDYLFNNIELCFLNGELDRVLYSSNNDRYYVSSSIHCKKSTLFNNNINFSTTLELYKSDDLLKVLPTFYNKHF